MYSGLLYVDDKPAIPRTKHTQVCAPPTQQMFTMVDKMTSHEQHLCRSVLQTQCHHDTQYDTRYNIFKDVYI